VQPDVLNIPVQEEEEQERGVIDDPSASKNEHTPTWPTKVVPTCEQAEFWKEVKVTRGLSLPTTGEAEGTVAGIELPPLLV